MRLWICRTAAKMKTNKTLFVLYKIARFFKLPELFHYIWDLHDALFGSDKTRAWETMAHQHEQEINEVMSLLSDETSRKVYSDILSFRKTRKRKYLKGNYSLNQYFQKDIMTLHDHEVYVGCGGFDGDTALAFAEFVNHKYDHIYIFEPDSQMIEVLKHNTNKLPKVALFPYGVWSKKSTLYFDASGGPSTSHISEEKGANQIETETIDHLLLDKNVSFLQMDIEGSEMDALKGAKETIQKYHPILTICIYHKPADFYEIPLYIHSLYEGYSLYIRHHCINRGAETVCYAIPQDKLRKGVGFND